MTKTPFTPFLRAALALWLFASALAVSAQSNNNFVNRTRLVGDNVTAAPVSTTGAGRDSGEPQHPGASSETLWWEWVAPQTATYTLDTAGSAIDTVLAVYEGTVLTELKRVVASDDPPGTTRARATLSTTAGQAYQIVVAPGSNANGSVALRISLVGTSPLPSFTGANSFNARARITIPDFIGQANTSDGGRDPGEPSHPFQSSETFWWQWTAPANGTATIDLRGDTVNAVALDTALNAYAGSEINQLFRVRANDDAPGTVASRVTFPTAAGQVYQIVAAPNDNSNGNLRLEVTFAPGAGQVPSFVGTNDFFQRPTISGTRAFGIGETTGGGRQSSEPSHPSMSSETFWWQWTAPADGTLVLDTDGSTLTSSAAFDTSLALYSGTSINQLTLVGNNTNAPGRVTSRISTEVKAGTAYQIVVGPQGNQNGNILLSLEFTPAPAGRLTNLSVRTTAGAGDQTLIVGFSLAGSGQKSLLIRAVGPTLEAFNVAGRLADPVLTLLSGANAVALNDNWGGGATLTGAFASVGAFPLPALSLDAAVLSTLAAGGYTAQVSSPAGASGVALAELYDAGGGTGTSLTNLSARSFVGTGAEILIVGFTVSGGPIKVLVRGVGPTLAAFGVGGTLANPILRVFSGNTLVGENDNWPSSLAPTFASVGAFALPQNTNDAAVSVTLPPGGYTAQLSGVGATTGVALVELYVLPP